MRVEVIKYEFKRPVKGFDLLNVLTMVFMEWDLGVLKLMNIDCNVYIYVHVSFWRQKKVS